MGALAKAAGSLWDWIEAGYPEEVAKRIVSGELPMDEASRMARAAEQGYGPVLYRGQRDYVPLEAYDDIWASSSPSVAQTYADSFQEYGGGTVIPLRTNASNLADVNARGSGWRSVQTNNRKVPGIETGVHRGTDRITEVVKDSGQYDGTHFRNIKDESAKVGGEQADTYNILGSRPDVKIRHANAAFHPTYRGPNIMGNADPRLLGGMAVGLTAAGLAAPEIAQRFPMPEAGNRASWLESVTNWADETQNSLRHATGGVSDYFFPESANDYLKKVNKEDEEPTWSDRLWAGLDLFKAPGK